MPTTNRSTTVATLPDVVSIAPGTVASGFVAPEGIDTSPRLPYRIVRGLRPGPTLLVTAGIHGAEYASIEAAYRVSAIDPSKVTGSLVVLPIVHPASYFARTVYVNPVDGKNPNREFPGSPTGSYAQQMAYWLETHVVAVADAYLDLHGGDLVESLAPFSIVDANDPGSVAMARAFGLPLLVEGEPGGMTIGAASRRGIPAVLAESGGQGLWPESAVRPLVEGVHRSMIHLGMIAGDLDQREVHTVRTFSWLRSEHAGAWRPRVHGGDRVRAGEVVGVVSDLLGNPVQTAVADIDGVVLFSVSSLAMNVGDPLVGIGGP